MSQIDWEPDFAELLAQLADVQEELLNVLTDKRSAMMRGDMDTLVSLQPREAQLHERLEQCHQQRQSLLERARHAGTPVESLGKLVALADTGERREMGRQVKQVNARMKLLQHESLTNWVLAQRTLLHLSQMFEIVASGGRQRPTYGRETLPTRGALVDQQA